MAEGYIRIGELARRSGVSPDLLRAWERRYRLLTPERSSGGFRLYSDDDLARVRAMTAFLADGLSAAQAARIAATKTAADAQTDGARPLLESARADLRRSLETFDEDGSHAALDALLSSLTLEAVLAEAILPLLRELGESWAKGEATVGQEHFASQLVRGRLVGLGRGWGRGHGRRALLAAPSGELHDIGLVVLALGLRGRGWRITFLGADTPIETIVDTARRLTPELTVLAAHAPAFFEQAAEELRRLGDVVSLALAGPGASAELADDLGAIHLGEGPLEAAERLTTSLAASA